MTTKSRNNSEFALQCVNWIEWRALAREQADTFS